MYMYPAGMLDAHALGITHSRVWVNTKKTKILEYRIRLVKVSI